MLYHKMHNRYEYNINNKYFLLLIYLLIQSIFKLGKLLFFKIFINIVKYQTDYYIKKEHTSL